MPFLRRRAETVVITGASAGVGRAVAREFARHGAKIGLIARGEERLTATANEVERLGGKALVLPADVADFDAIDRAAESIERRFGRIDIWINNAMTSVFSPVRQMQPEEYRRVTEVTYLGYVHGTLVALKRMLPRDRGTIVQVGSALAYRSIPLQSAYCAAKAAIRGFTDALRCELIHDKSRVHITSVHLPAVNTPQFDWVKSRLPRRPQPVPPIYQPEVAARAIYWTSHQRRRDLYLGASTLKAVWANVVAPGVLDRMLARSGYDNQQTQEPERQNRPHNLWRPVPADFNAHAAHGRFDDQARTWSPQFTFGLHGMPGRAIALLAGGLAAFGIAAILRKRANKDTADAPLSFPAGRRSRFTPATHR